MNNPLIFAMFAVGMLILPIAKTRQDYPHFSREKALKYLRKDETRLRFALERLWSLQLGIASLMTVLVIGFLLQWDEPTALLVPHIALLAAGMLCNGVLVGLPGYVCVRHDRDEHRRREARAARKAAKEH